MTELSRNLKYEHVFAIVRVDSFHHHDATAEDTITVKKIVLSRQLAEEEVARLNALNRDKGCRYFWQLTRLERTGELADVSASAPSKGAATTAASS